MTIELGKTRDIAIVGVGCRLPGADTADQFWQNVRNGVCSIKRYTDDELRRSGVPSALREDPDFVPASGALDNAQRFDAGFFQFSPLEADLMDPQHRLFLKCAWEALESAGCDPGQYAGRIGCFGGSGMSLYSGPEQNSYFTRQLLPNKGKLQELEGPQVTIANRSDYLCTRVSYKLNLRGPSVNVQTACSSGLVAVHMACQAILAGECDMALAGAAAVHIPLATGYRYREGGLFAKDGLCRSFDAKATGTVGGSGAVVMLLKPMDAAVRDGDDIVAVIKGTATNNDGSDKVSFMAPSVHGQVDVICRAQAAAGITADTIGYLEGHGTGTPMGDPIEVAALTHAFRRSTQAKNFCALGSAKANIGHLDTAAGMAGLLRAAMIVNRGEIPPNVNFQEPNKQIDQSDCPFYFPVARRFWEDNGRPRRAAVSAFGAGGTNAHVILEAHTPLGPTAGNGPYVIGLSAKTPNALRNTAKKWVDGLRTLQNGDVNDFCYTANAGRRRFSVRVASVSDNAQNLATDLAKRADNLTVGQNGRPKLAFVFSGQGSQFPAMGKRLMERYDIFRSTINLCDRIASPTLDLSLERLLSEGDPRVHSTKYTQPALFAFEYALAMLWEDLGIRPDAVIGHSLGEYVAATVAKVMPVETALPLVIQRASLMDALPPDGCMAAIFAGRSEVEDIASRCGVEVAAENALEMTVISGAKHAVQKTLDELQKAGVSGRHLQTSHAFHSKLMEPALEPYRRLLMKQQLSLPTIIMVSNLTGKPEARAFTKAEYWLHHLREPVLFRSGLESLSAGGCDAFLEIGPKASLIPIGRQVLPDSRWFCSVGKNETGEDLHSAAAGLFEAGFDIELAGLHNKGVRRVNAPTYGFDEAACWVEGTEAREPPAEPYLRVVWRPRSAPQPTQPAKNHERWLLVAPGTSSDLDLVGALRTLGASCEVVAPSDVANALSRSGFDHVVFLAADAIESAFAAPANWQILKGARETALQAVIHTTEPKLWLVTKNGQSRLSGPCTPEQAAIWGMGRTLRLEHPELRLTCLDVGSSLSEEIARCLVSKSPDDEMVLEGGIIRTSFLESVEAPVRSLPISPEASYLLTGGLGALGLQIASRLVEGGARHLVLMGRRGRSVDSEASIRALEAAGAAVMVVQGDVAKTSDVDRTFTAAAASGRPVRGIVHAAGIIEDGMFANQSWEAFIRPFTAKVTGARNLLDRSRGQELDFFVSFSSVASVFGSPGQSGYASANAALDALAASHAHEIKSLSWGPWANGGMAHRTVKANHKMRHARLANITAVDGANDFIRATASEPAHLCLAKFNSSPPLDQGLAAVARWVWNYQETQPTQSIATTCRMDFERVVRQRVAQVLGVEESAVPSNASFHDMGLDSMMLLQLRNLLAQDLKRAIPTTLVFRFPTLRQLSNALDDTPKKPAIDEAGAHAQQAGSDPEDAIAIVGMACRYPGGVKDAETLWMRLAQGDDCVKPVPDGRWTRSQGQRHACEAALLSDVTRFDARFFGISPREAACMDPQQRILLEITWEALENAGCAPGGLVGSSTGVFIGMGSDDYQNLTVQPNMAGECDLYTGTGTSRGVAAGRIAYVLGLMGPAMQVDTSCSSSLVAVHQACASLRAGETTMAIAGGVHLLLSSMSPVVRSKVTALSPSGRCKPFSAGADGFGLGEGAGVVVLKRLCDARAAGDCILGLILASATNHNGRSNGLTAPSEAAQEALITRTLELGGVCAADVDYVEAHGTGTALGDPIELAALQRALATHRADKSPLLVGSVKSNMGHLEAAAGILALHKALLMLQRGAIPATLHFDVPNPHIPWSENNIEVPGSLRQWPRPGLRRVGVSSFGMSGTNAHLLLQGASSVLSTASPPTDYLLCLSAQSPQALGELTRRWVEWLQSDPSNDLADACWTSQHSRTHFDCRLAVTGATRAELLARLRKAGEGTADFGIYLTGTEPADSPTATAAKRYVRRDNVLEGAKPPRPVPVSRRPPTYPFQATSYWKPKKESPMSCDTDYSNALDSVVNLFADLMHAPASSVDPKVCLLRQGADSLVFAAAVRKLELAFGRRYSIQDLFDKFNSPERLARDIVNDNDLNAVADRTAPEDASMQAASPLPTATTPPEQPETEILARVTQIFADLMHTEPSSLDTETCLLRQGADSMVFASAVRRLEEAFGKRFSIQDLFDKYNSPRRLVKYIVNRPDVAPVTNAQAMPAPAPRPAAPRPDSPDTPAAPPNEGALTNEQLRYLEAFSSRFNESHRESMQYRHRSWHVCTTRRSSAGFRDETKRLLYPIVATRSSGARIWDLDGNSYIDLSLGFGANLLGHQPACVTDAINEQMKLGMQLGPDSDLAADVASLVCDLTGMERVLFNNSGTEAVMTAMRIARAATGRNKVVMFDGAYHGHFDGTLAVAAADGTAIPMARGVVPSLVEDTVVLPWNDDTVFSYLQQHGQSIAAIIVEPVQNRRPDVHPTDFLQRLRAVATQARIALIFDEVLVGFRIAPGGAQEHFGVKADIALYGKVVGGGLPLGIVAGRKEWMDVVDGGEWDPASGGPKTDTTYTAGTFSKHPLTMAASRALLGEIKRDGAALCRRLNARTESLRSRVNAIFESRRIPLEMVAFGSFFRFSCRNNLSFVRQPLELDVFFYHLIANGVYLWEGRTCFLSSAHDDAIVDDIVRAVKASIEQMQAGGFWSPSYKLAAPNKRTKTSDTAPGMSIYFFGDYEAEFNPAKYQTVVDSVRFADENGFEAVWLPERHFHTFGGLSPNPSVLAAALTQVTKYLSIRGSVILPLHHPVRVAEEWAVVDNLSSGRVGVAFASGWHADDFIFAPESFDSRSDITLRNAETVRTLWLRDSVTAVNGAGASTTLRLHPLPKQEAVPTWIASLGNPKTIVAAAQAGHNLLTNLIGQDIGELADKIRQYRSARSTAGLDRGRVTVLLHTYVGPTLNKVHAVAGVPFKKYLSSSMGLFQKMAGTHAGSADLESLSDADRDYLLEKAYQRYIRDRALIGTRQSCQAVLRALREADVDEIACFVDFGVTSEQLGEGLPRLAEILQDWTQLTNKLPPPPRRLTYNAMAPIVAPDKPADAPVPTSAADRGFPMTDDQKMLWVIAKISREGSLAYNSSTSLRLIGNLNRRAFIRSVEDVVARHDALRSYVSEDGNVQYVRAASTFKLTEVDLEKSTRAQRESTLTKLLREQGALDFDLSQSLCRMQLVRVDSNSHVFTLTVHHIAADGVSIGNILQEIQHFYNGACTGHLVPLEAPMQFSQFLDERDKLAKTELFQDQASYWRTQIARQVGPLEIATDFPRPRPKSFAGARKTRVLSPSQASRLAEFSRQHGFTHFMTLLGAYALLLHRISQQPDGLLGVSFAGRNALDASTTVGYCSTIFPIRSQVNLAMSALDYLRQLKKTLLEAYANQDVPFASLVKEQSVGRDQSRSPLFTTAFNWDRYVVPEMHELKVHYEAQPISAAEYDLMPSVMEVEGGLVVNWDYNRDLFKPETIDRLADAFAVILEDILSRPDQKAQDLQLTKGGPESLSILDGPIADRGKSPFSEFTLQNEFSKRATETPQAIAVRSADEKMSYDVLDRDSNRVAHWLVANGIRRGEPVAICATPGLPMVVAVLGVLKSGGCYVPMRADWPRNRMRQIFRDAGIRAVLTDDAAAGEIPHDDALLAFLDDKHFWAGMPTHNPRVPGTPDDLAYVIYTSGSTGTPKGVELTHANVFNILASMHADLDFDRGDVMLNVAGLSSDMSVPDLFLPLLSGAQLVVATVEERHHPKALVEAIISRGVSVMQAAPAIYRLLLEQGWQGDKHRLKLVVGAEAIRTDLAVRLIGCARMLWNLYGPTETSVWSTGIRIDQDEAKKSNISIGAPLLNTSVYVMDKAMNPVLKGMPGEIVIGGSGVALGYRGNKSLTDASFVVNPARRGERMYRTGDFGRIRLDGMLEFLGRCDNQVKVRGFRVELGEIEARMREIPQVREGVIVHAVGDDGEGFLTAYIALHEADGDCSNSVIHAALRSDLPMYMLPRSYVRLKALPRTANGKVDRTCLPAPLPTSHETEGKTRVSGETVSAVLRAYKRVLKGTTLDAQSDFFMIGGSSLILHELQVALRDELAVKVPILSLFRYPTPGSLAKWIDKGTAKSRANGSAPGHLQQQQSYSKAGI